MTSRRATVWALILGALSLLVFYLARPGRSVFQTPGSSTGLALAILWGGLSLVMPSRWRQTCLGMFGGAVGLSTTYIFVVGPGTLWPIAIVLTAWAAAQPIAIGTGVGWLLGRLFHRTA